MPEIVKFTGRDRSNISKTLIEMANEDLLEREENDQVGRNAAIVYKLVTKGEI